MWSNSDELAASAELGEAIAKGFQFNCVTKKWKKALFIRNSIFPACWLHLFRVLVSILQPLQADSESTDVVFSNLPQKFTLRLP